MTSLLPRYWNYLRGYATKQMYRRVEFVFADSRMPT
jgi:hypothetical protein